MGDKRERMTDDTDQDRLDIRNGERFTTKDVLHQPLWIRWPLYLILLFILIVALYIIGRLMPFEPLKIEDVQISPDKACGGQEVQVTYTGYLEGGLYTVDNLHGFAYWLSGTDPRPYSSIYFTEDELEPFPTLEFEGPTRRVSPWPEDQWHAGVDATIYGKRFGFVPVEQRFHLESEDYLDTQSRYSDFCENSTEE